MFKPNLTLKLMTCVMILNFSKSLYFVVGFPKK